MGPFSLQEELAGSQRQERRATREKTEARAGEKGLRSGENALRSDENGLRSSKNRLRSGQNGLRDDTENRSRSRDGDPDELRLRRRDGHRCGSGHGALVVDAVAKGNAVLCDEDLAPADTGRAAAHDGQEDHNGELFKCGTTKKSI